MTKLSSGIWKFPYEPACVLKVEGPDAAVFLQGQFTNDLRDLKPGSSVYGLWLDRRGRVIGDSHVAKDPGDGFWIVSLGTAAAAIAAHLQAHIIADDVTVDDRTDGALGLTLLGPGSGQRLLAPEGVIVVFPGRRGGSESWEWILDRSRAGAALEAAADLPTASAAQMERLRILAQVPAVPADIGPGDLPNEGALDRDAISYSKGCYLGQEVMARIKSRGRLRRRLVRVEGAGAPPAVPAALWLDGRRQGELRSSAADGAGFVGLALVAAESAAAGTPFSFADGGPAALAVAQTAAGQVRPECV